jgi:hypothetical protein
MPASNLLEVTAWVMAERLNLALGCRLKKSNNSRLHKSSQKSLINKHSLSSILISFT